MPQVEHGIRSIRFHWPEHKLTIELSQLQEQRNGDVIAKFKAITLQQGYKSLIHGAKFNLSSTRARTELERTLNEHFPEPEWGSLLEFICYHADLKMSEREPVEEIFETGEYQPPKYMIYPLLPLDEPTIIFGEGGSGKSFVALLLALIMSLPWEDNMLGLHPKQKATVLILDYETTKRTVATRLGQLQRGLDQPAFPIHYRRCTLPLADDIEEIQQIIIDKKITCVIIDSLGAATGGDLNSAETALRFAQAIRSLNITTLIIAHQSKDQITKKKSVFGSVFFWNFARFIYELRNVQEPGESEISIGLFNRKSNISNLHPPLGLRFSFNEDKLYVSREDVKAVPEFRGQLGGKQQVYELLAGGAMGVQDISKELDMPDNTVRTYLNRLKNDNRVIKIGDQWGRRIEDE